MNKLIIENRTDLTDIIALDMIKSVVSLGRISKNNKQYCYVSTIEHDGTVYFISTDLNKKSDRFVIKKRGIDQ